MNAHSEGSSQNHAEAKSVTLIPVTLKEAALDSPSFRGIVIHFQKQVDTLEQWLTNYLRSSAAVVSNLQALNTSVGDISANALPQHVSESLLDHDYTVLALGRYHEGIHVFWSNVCKRARDIESNIIKPLNYFRDTELKAYANDRKSFEKAQLLYDNMVLRFASQSKSKEPSAIREDAFALYEARKAYSKAAFVFVVRFAQLRHSVNHCIINAFVGDWMSQADASTHLMGIFSAFLREMKRIKICDAGMDSSVTKYSQELNNVSRVLEQDIEIAFRPPRDLSEYTYFTINYQEKPVQDRFATKQGWLLIRTVSSYGKALKYNWQRRWFFIDAQGSFGWLINAPNNGGVKQSEKLGVLLCNVRLAPNEERRFCFVVKTTTTTLLLQAETAGNLNEWLSAFDIAKRRAVGTSPNKNSAFTIMASPDANFAGPHIEDDERVRALVSVDEIDNSKGIKKSNSRKDTVPAENSAGLSSLINASHKALAGQDTSPLSKSIRPHHEVLERNVPLGSSLAPITLTNPPISTTLSNQALVIRDFSDPSNPALMSNLWGSFHWAQKDLPIDKPSNSTSKNVRDRSFSVDDIPVPQISQGQPQVMPAMMEDQQESRDSILESAPLGETQFHGRRKALSVDSEDVSVPHFPPGYPVELKTQNSQFHALFPDVQKSEVVLMVVRVSWDVSDFHHITGRLYVTIKGLYFYSNFYGLILVHAIHMSEINATRSISHQECDYLFLETNLSGQVKIEMYLDSARLFEQRLKIIMSHHQEDSGNEMSGVIDKLVRVEHQNRIGLEEYDEVHPSEVSMDPFRPNVYTDGYVIFQLGY